MMFRLDSRIAGTRNLACLALAAMLSSWNGAQAKAPSSPRSETFRFAVISDFHMDLEKLGNVMEDVSAQNMDTMVVVGDSCDGQEQEYKAIESFLKSRTSPKNLFFVIGNHEYYAGYHKNGGDYDEAGFPNGETTAGCKARFNRFRGALPDGPVYYDARVHGYHFLFLGGERSRMDDPKLLDDAFLTSTQLDWLRARLKEDANQSRPIFVFLHQPFPGTVSGSGKSGEDGSRSIRQDQELKAILSAYPQVLFFSGDTHWELNLPTTHHTSESFRFNLFNTSSARDPYNAKDEAIERNMSEGLFVRATPETVIVQGRDFLGHQFVPGQTYEIQMPKSPAK